MIAIQNFSFKYSGSKKDAISDISLHVKKGDFLGVIGGSGAGKTTLLQSINGIIPHYLRGELRGKVRVGGFDTIENQPEELARFAGSIRQDIDSQFVASVVEDEILFGLENFGVPDGKIENRLKNALDKIGIADLRERTIATLSGGQKQKVAIAAVVALMPEVLILDEPTGELDPKSSRQIFALLRELNEKHGITIVLVEQKIMLLCEFTKNLAVMKEGKILFHGPVRDVLAHSREMLEAGVNCPRVVTLCDRLKEKKLYGGITPIGLPDAEKMIREALPC